MYDQDPWPPNVTPSLSGILGFSMLMVGMDLLHIFHLGFARDLCASAIRIMVSKRAYFRGRNQDLRLQVATQRLKWFAKNQKYTLVISKLSKQNLNWKTDEYPELKAKGFDTFVVLRWLVWEIGQKDIGNDLLATVTRLGLMLYFWMVSTQNTENYLKGF